MTKQEFYERIRTNLPIKRNTDSFLESVKQFYKKYIDDIEALDNNEFTSCASNKIQTISKVKDCVSTIQDVIQTYLDSCHSEAYSLLKNKIVNPDGTLKIRIISIKPTKDQDSYFYRSRKDDGTIRSFKDMFHVPNHKRGLIKTTRFSTPGYPCLYLGNTIYDCWEEMRRPFFETLYFSGYKVKKEFKVYDLLKPTKEDFESSDLSDLLEQLVYVIACQFTVHNDKDFFKPEYIIPQLILELIITSNRNTTHSDSLPWGIAFTSTHLADDFLYKEDYLKNIAIPVVDTTNEYCSYLSSLFEISNPINYRYEELKERDSGLCWGTIGADEFTALKESYDATKMGFLEKRLIENATYNKL